MRTVRRGVYRHYKGRLYEVMGTAFHSETLEPMVVYRARYTSKKFGKNSMWVRPLALFQEQVIVAGKQVPRFLFVRTGRASKK